MIQGCNQGHVWGTCTVGSIPKEIPIVPRSRCKACRTEQVERDKVAETVAARVRDPVQELFYGKPNPSIPRRSW